MLSLTSFHSWKAGSLNSPQTPLCSLALGPEESRAENRVLPGWKTGPRTCKIHNAPKSGERAEVLWRPHSFMVPVPLCCQPILTLQPSPSSWRWDPCQKLFSRANGTFSPFPCRGWAACFGSMEHQDSSCSTSCLFKGHSLASTCYRPSTMWKHQFLWGSCRVCKTTATFGQYFRRRWRHLTNAAALMKRKPRYRASKTKGPVHSGCVQPKPTLALWQMLECWGVWPQSTLVSFCCTVKPGVF